MSSPVPPDAAAAPGLPPDTAPRYGDRVTFDAVYQVAPQPAGKRLQEVVLLRDDGERWIRAYRPVPDEFQYQGRRVRVTGRPYTNPPTVQSVDATHFALDTIEVAPGETPITPAPTTLPPPPLARSAGAARAQAGWYAVCVGTRRGDDLAFSDGGTLPLSVPSRALVPPPADGEHSMLVWVTPDGVLDVRTVCPGVMPRCGVVDGSAR